MSGGWSVFVAAIVVLNVAGCAFLLFWARSKREEGEGLVGHDFDGIEELDMPLPRWWLWTFVGTIAFTVVYLAMYPGFGSFAGALGWSQENQHAAEVAEIDARVRPIFAAYAARPIEELARDEKALASGRRLFANTCAACHGADARGGVGFPYLADDDWLYGGEPETIRTTILTGRQGFMPPFAPALGDQGVKEVVQYVRSLSGQSSDAALAEAGKARFQTICIACHGMDGRGNKALGAPNLTDDVWLFGGSADDIEYGLRHGRSSRMPAHGDLLGADKAHVVAGYVFSLSQPGNGLPETEASAN
jgi:cytochrome c oxidase cbb3-type subunit 3